jgi:hypothetical protein
MRLILAVSLGASLFLEIDFRTRQESHPWVCPQRTFGPSLKR